MTSRQATRSRLSFSWNDGSTGEVDTVGLVLLSLKHHLQNVCGSKEAFLGRSNQGVGQGTLAESWMEEGRSHMATGICALDWPWPTGRSAFISWNVSEYVKNLLIQVASKYHKANQPNKVSVQNIRAYSSLIMTYSFWAIARVYPWASPCLPLLLPLRVIPFRPMGKNDKGI